MPSATTDGLRWNWSRPLYAVIGLQGSVFISIHSARQRFPPILDPKGAGLVTSRNAKKFSSVCQEIRSLVYF
ncbi:MAG: hypothetical protein MI923_05890 [Phycisphaerales bacterium]|nr:hypothetical protein [Phycisphaerales bacterium]